MHWNIGTYQYRELVEELNGVSVDSTSTAITAGTIAEKLAEAVQNGAPKFKDLVNQLKNKTGFNTGDTLDKDNLSGALGQDKTQIQALLKAEFGFDVQNSGNQIDVENPVSTNKVTVKVKKADGGDPDGENKGSSLVQKNTDKNIPQDIPIEVLVDEELVTNLVTGGGAEQKKAKAKEIAQKLADRLKKIVEKTKLFSGNWNPGQELVKEEFGANSPNVSADTSNRKVTVNAGVPTGNGSKNETVSVSITGSSGGTDFDNLVEKLASEVKTQASGGNLTAGKLKNALENAREQIKDLVNKEFGIATVTQASDINVEGPGNDNKVTVKIGSQTGVTGNAQINTGSGSDITIEVKGGTELGSAYKANAIASVLALALVNEKVNEALKNKSVTISIPGNTGNDKVTIEVSSASSNAVARRIARRLAHSLKNSITGIDTHNAKELKNAIGDNVKEALAGLINKQYFSSIKKDHISASEDPVGNKKVKVVISDKSGSTQEGSSTAEVVSSSDNKGVKVTIPDIGGKDAAEKQKKATEIANRIASFVALAALTHQISSTISSKENLNASEIQGALSSAKDQIAKLVTGYNGAAVHEPTNGISVGKVENKVTVTFGKSTKFKELVEQLVSQVETQLKNAPTSPSDLATKLNAALNTVGNTKIKPLAESMVDTTKAERVNDVQVSKQGSDKVTVQIGSGSEPKGESAEVEFKHTSTTHKATVVIAL